MNPAQVSIANTEVDLSASFPVKPKEVAKEAAGSGDAQTAETAPEPGSDLAPPPAQLDPDSRRQAKLEAKRQAKLQAERQAKLHAKRQAKLKAKRHAKALVRVGFVDPPDARIENVPAVRTVPGQPQTAAAGMTASQPQKPPPPPPVGRSQFRFRHAMIFLSFLIMVVGPAAVSGWYLWTRAQDQYASYMGFSVRAEDPMPSVASLLGPLDLGGSSTPDADILYEFIQSQELVLRVNEKLDLAAIWSKVDPQLDPVFAYRTGGSIEDLLGHWVRKVKVVYDSGNGLIELRVLAFEPQDAKAIAEAILEESTKLINELSVAAREDAIGYARTELEKALAQLKEARRVMTEFRNRTQIVDPEIDIQGQAGILASLQQQLAEALIELDLLRETTRGGDPRIAQAERRIKVIEARVESEKRKFGSGNEDAEAYATLLGEFESLTVDREFAEESYIAARAAFDGAQAEALRQTRYLAAHVRPTLAEKPEYPKRLTLFGLITLFAFLVWAVLSLIAYSLRDRR